MNKTLVLDASVVLLLFLPNKKSEEAKQLFDEIISGRIKVIEPTFLLLEVGNVLLKKGKLSILEISQAMTYLEQSLIQFTTLSNEDIQALPILAQTHSLSFYDAIYLHLAEKNNAILITEDKALLAVNQLTRSLATWRNS